MEKIVDQRIERHKQHLVIDILVIAISRWAARQKLLSKSRDRKPMSVILLKGNQGNLHKDVKDYLDYPERVKFTDI
ncbi:MAG: hypothetical protein H0U50_09905 [Pyrinomonadaceae bacterium]|nr:hypothetical protein [Pyrinomonadaceae bacterium]